MIAPNRLAPDATQPLQTYYAQAGPIMQQLFGPIPFAWASLHRGFDSSTVFHGPLSPHTHPKGPIVDVTTSAGTARYPQLSAERIEGLVQHGAIEIHSWSPTPNNPERAAFARLLVERTSHAMDDARFLEAVFAMRAVLFEDGIEGIPVFDGGANIAIWIPFTDAPLYDRVRAWLHQLCAKAVERHPDLVTLEPNTHGGSRAHLHVSTNAPGRHSIVPYSARASEGYPIAFPVAWAKIAHFKNGSINIENLKPWLDEHGEMFEAELKVIRYQHFGDRGFATPPEIMPAQKIRGPIITPAVALLQDGRSHTAQEILDYALKLGLLSKDVTRKYVYTSLIEYIARTQGNGHKPAIVQNIDRSFRINEPPDNWPAVEEAPTKITPEKQQLIDRLAATVHGDDPAAFEQAVCDAFGALGFAAAHVGGHQAPDGYADALLGPLGYRVMIECKTGGAEIPHPDAFEAAKYKEAYEAQYCMLIGPGFGGEVEIKKELLNHGVSGWTVDDLQTLLSANTDALKMQPLFQQGFAADAIDDLLWEQHHGQAKRVRIIADALVRAGAATQSAYHGKPADSPRITEDVAMILVNQELAPEGVTCNREDLRAAIAYLANPLVNRIHQSNDGTIVILTLSSFHR